MTHHTVCVYGTLKQGMKNHYLLEESEFLGADVTTGRFRMVDVGFPAIVPDEAGHPVAVEVYRVDTPNRASSSEKTHATPVRSQNHARKSAALSFSHAVSALSAATTTMPEE